MRIENNGYNPAFGAKMLENDTLRAVRMYARNLGKETKIDEALSNIDRVRKNTLLKMDICYTEDRPTVIFSKYERTRNNITGLYTGDYVLRSQTEFENTEKKNINPVKFAYQKLIKLSNGAPDNNMYQQVVIDKSFNARKNRLF